MADLPCFIVGADAVDDDQALALAGCGARKHVVTSLCKDKERNATEIVWHAPAKREKCPVLVTESWELAAFSEVAPQDRHYHKKGTEIYTVLEGEMWIEVEGKVHHLEEGDIIVVNPGVVHQVLREGIFIAQVITVNCGGKDDKFVV